MQFAIPGEENLDTRGSLRRWKMKRRNCYKGFGSFGLTKPPTTPVGVMRPVTPHSRQGCRQILAQRVRRVRRRRNPSFFFRERRIARPLIRPTGCSPDGAQRNPGSRCQRPGCRAQ